GNAFGPRLSADGTKVAFASSAKNLPDASGDGDSHAFLADLATGSLQLVDRATDGTIGNGAVRHVDIDADGSRVAFDSSADNLGVATNNASQIYVRDVAASTLTWASVPEDGVATHAQADAPFLSADGHKVAFTNSSPEFGYGQPQDTLYSYLRDLHAGVTTSLSTGIPGSVIEAPVLTADASKATLSAGDFFGFFGTFVRDVASGALAPAAAKDGTTTPPRGPSHLAAIA